MNLLHWSLCLAMAGVFVAASQSSAHPAQQELPAQVRNTFAFDVQAPRSLVTPLFGADRERVWAEGWDPSFVHPQPAADRAGAVFTVKHSGHTSTWVTTALDLESGRIQYVYFIPGAMTTLIDIHVSSTGPAATHVEVTYERTALSSELNDHIRQLGEQDRQSAEHWRKAIEAYVHGKGSSPGDEPTPVKHP